MVIARRLFPKHGVDITKGTIGYGNPEGRIHAVVIGYLGGPSSNPLQIPPSPVF